MSSDYHHPGSIKRLPVVATNAKVEQFRQELRAKPPAEPKPPSAPSPPPPPADALRDKVIQAIQQVYDPEIPVNIYDLGLIYDIHINPDQIVHVKMTLTAPGCPVAGTLPGEVERMIETVPEVRSARVELVWDPPWTKDRMSEAALLELGLF